MSTFRTEDPRRRGVTAVLVAVTFTALLGCAALTVDMGYVFVAHGDMQCAVDASALAGATGAPISDQLATSRAQSTGSANRVTVSALARDEIHVQVGYWNSHSNGGTFSLPDGTEAARPNAARVFGARPGISLFFAGILGHHHVDIAKAATAIYGGGICAGMWGLNGVSADGNIFTDSYDSSVGVYGPGNIDLNGDLCSDQAVTLDGGVDIGGDVMYGFDYDLTISGQGYTIHGGTGPQNRSVSVPTIDMITAAANNDNATIPLTDLHNRDPFGGTTWDLTNVTGQDTLTLIAGTYYLTSAQLAGGAQIIVTGPTTFYIDGPADFSGGGLINPTQDPANLIIYSTGPTLTIDGGAGFYGAVIAPNTTVRFYGGSQIYGTVMAGFLDLRGATQIHVDSDVVRDIFGVGPEAPILVE